SLHRVSGQEPDRVDGEGVQLVLPHRLLSRRGRARRHLDPVVRCRSPLGQECRVPACSPEGLRVRNGARMGRAEDWLEPGERVMFRTGLHPMAFAGALSLALFVAVLVLRVIGPSDLPQAPEAQIGVVGALVALGGSVPALLRWRHTVLLVTDRRVLVRSGTYRQHMLATPL